MIGGQTLSTKQAEENFILSQNESNPVESAEAVETIEETTFIEAKTSQVDLKMKFTRLKKAMRKRSVSIF
ncbi:MAG TPA: hypothetical protein VGB68_06965 [Pyrinomonadaceae bacterium]|jgi:hypothetical protein